MISLQEMQTFMDSLPVQKTSEIFCQVYEKLFDIDPKVFKSAGFRTQLVRTIDSNFPYMNQQGKQFVAFVVVPFLLQNVFGRSNILNDPIQLNRNDEYLQDILWSIQQEMVETETLTSEDDENFIEECDDENEEQETLSIYVMDDDYLDYVMDNDHLDYETEEESSIEF